MKKPDIAKPRTRWTGVSQAAAADELDRVIRQILHDLRAGKDATLPGLGKFTRGSDGRVAFQRDRGGSRG